MIRSRLQALALCGGLALCVLPRALASDDDDERPRAGTTGAPPTTPLDASSAVERASRRALGEGLAWLAAQQRTTADGGLPAVGARPGRWAPVGVGALGALAFLADGNTPGRGPYGDVVDDLVDYLVALADMRQGSETRGYISRQGDQTSQTHGHGYATLVLAQAYGMSGRDERLQRVLEAAVRRIEDSQGAEGGWGYQPVVEAFHEGSVTIAHAQALRAAHDAGIRIDLDVVTRADAYVRRLQKEDGTFRYMLDDERSSIALTAAAISTLNATGSYDDPVIQAGIDAIFRGLDRMRVDGEEEDFPYYMRLHLAQALWQLSDPEPFRRWWEEERKTILRSQRADGSWGDSPYGDCYATAVNCLALAVPEGVLPIFQR